MGVSALTHLQLGGHGTRNVGTGAEALPANKDARMVCVQALAGNSGTVFVGKSDVTNSTGADNATTGLALGAGDISPWIPLPDGGLDQLYVIGSAVGQNITFMWLS